MGKLLAMGQGAELGFMLRLASVASPEIRLPRLAVVPHSKPLLVVGVLVAVTSPFNVAEKLPTAVGLLV